MSSRNSSSEPESQENTEPTPPPLNRTSTQDQPRVCWICYSDSNEDDDKSATTWRTPCPCALTAHEACLLDWVADLENPKNPKAKSGKIKCPQCRSEIKIARPRSFVVDGIKALDRLATKLTVPGVVFTFAGTLWAGAFYHGFQSIYWVFGPEDAERILEHASHHRGAIQIGLPLIPLNLIMARTRYSDFFLPATTIFLISNQLYDSFELDLTLWPPTASTVFACLPLIRNTYISLWDYTFGDLQKKWMAEIQPRAGQDEDTNGNGNDAEGDAELPDGDVLLELDVNIDIGGGMADNFQAEAAPPPPPIANPNRAPGAGHDAAGLGNQQPANPVPVQAGPIAANANALVVEGSSLATTILGALAFPAISAGMGTLLELALPATWTTTSLAAAPNMSPFNSETLSQLWSIITGRVGEKTASGLTRLPLLQTRWGRTVIGGCIFIVVKDFLNLYRGYRLAKSHRQRRVMDWDRRTRTWQLPTQ